MFAADYKGDVSGLAVPGPAEGKAERTGRTSARARADRVSGRVPLARRDRSPASRSREGVRVRPQLLAKVLGSNETQESSLALVFRYADERGLALVDLADLHAVLGFLESKEGKEDLTGIGGVSKQTIGVLLRSLVAARGQRGDVFFGEPQFEIADLLRTAPDGRGVITSSSSRRSRRSPALFSTVLMWLLAELFEQLPEVGDLDKPKLVFFFDEAHLLFDDATEAFMAQSSGRCA